MKKHIIKAVAFGGLLAMAGLGLASTASAAKVPVNPDTTTIVAKNSFIIPKNPEKVDTKVTATGSFKINHVDKDDKTITTSYGDTDRFLKGYYKSFQQEYGQTNIIMTDITDKNNRIEVDYGKIGYFEGEKVSVKMILSDFHLADKNTVTTGPDSAWNVLNGDKGINSNGKSFGFLLSDNAFSGWYSANLASYDIQLVVTDKNGNDVTFKDDAYLGINSLNGCTSTLGFESIRYENQENTDYYVTNDSVLEEYTNIFTGKKQIGGANKFVAGSPSDLWASGGSDELGAPKFNQSTVSYKLNNKNPKFTYYGGRIGTWISFSSATLFNVVPDKPTKTVEKGNVDWDKKELLPGENFTYSIHQKVNTLGVDILSIYSTFKIIDMLDKNVEYVSSKLVDKDGKSVDEKGSYAYDSAKHTLTYTASDEFLKTGMAYNGETYTLKVNVKVKSTVKASDVITNTANVVINKNDQNTNEVTNPVKEPQIPAPKKSVVNNSGTDINGKTLLAGEKINYRVDQKVNTLGEDILIKYTKFSMTDNLPKEVTYAGNAYVEKDGKKVEDAKTISYDEAKHQVVFNADSTFLSSMTMNSETYTLVIPVTVIETVKASDIIKNTAATVVNETVKDTNEVTNPVKETEIKKPQKKVLDADGAEIDGAKVSAGDTLIYSVDQQVNKMGEDILLPYKKFIMTDKLDPKVSFSHAEVLKNGDILEEAKEISYDETTHTVVFNADSEFLKNMEMNNEIYTLKIYTTVIEEIAEGQTIVNIANVQVNDSENETNEVTNEIQVPKLDLTVKKFTDQLQQVDEDGQLIYEEDIQEGVTYELLANEEITFPNGELIFEAENSFGEATTGEDGLANFTDLYEGEYVLYERNAPLGIQVDPEPIYVSLSVKDGETVVTTDHRDPLQEVLIHGHKVFENEDGKFEPGEGAVFGLYHALDYVVDEEVTVKKDTLVAKMNSDKDGNFSYQGILIPGQVYAVKEISTRETHLLNQKVFYYRYEPTSNEAVHSVEFFENGYVENEKFLPYKALEDFGDVDNNEDEDVTTEDNTQSELKLLTKETNETTTDTEENQDTSSSTENSETDTTNDMDTEQESDVDEVKELDEEKEPIKNILTKHDNFNKSILGEDGELLDKKDVNVGDKVTFVLTAKVPNDKDVDPLIISDELEKAFLLDEKSVKVVSGEEDIKDLGTLIADSEKGLIKWTAKEPENFKGKEITVTFDVVVKDVDFTEYLDESGYITVPNKAYFTYGDETLDDTVYVTVLQEKPTKLPSTSGQDNTMQQIAQIMLSLALLSVGLLAGAKAIKASERE